MKEIMERKRNVFVMVLPGNNKARRFEAGLYIYVWVSKYWKQNFHTQY